jgi:hypothetical protein
MVLRLGMAYCGRGRNFDGKWWDSYGDKPEFQERILKVLGARIRFTGEALLRGFCAERELGDEMAQRALAGGGKRDREEDTLVREAHDFMRDALLGRGDAAIAGVETPRQRERRTAEDRLRDTLGSHGLRPSE